MGVGVDEARIGGRSLQIDIAGARRGRPRAVELSGIGDLAVLDRQGLHDGVAGVDRAAMNQQVLRRSRRRQGEAGRQDQSVQNRAHASPAVNHCVH